MEAVMLRSGPLKWFVIGGGLGAASMFLLDPDRGARRRHGLVDRLRGTAGEVQDLAGKARRDAENRAHGLAARAHGSPPTRRARRLMTTGMPERRLVEIGGGGLGVLYGLVRGGLVGTGALLAGLSVLAHAMVPRQDGIIRVQKTLTIRRPLEEVFEFFTRFENYPRFMQHVLEVRKEGERMHWRVAGPAGVPIAWDAEITQLLPNRKIVWRSVEGSMIEHHGEVHFERVGDATRISVHMAYRPPGGAVTHAVAAFLQGDPKTLMDDDLLRLKSLLELGKATGHGGEVHRDEFH